MMNMIYDLNLIERELFDKDFDDKDFLIFKDRMLDADNLTKEELVLESISFIQSFLSKVKSEDEILENAHTRFDDGYDEGREDGWNEGYREGFKDGVGEGYE